jgi:hypothetical protein
MFYNGLAMWCANGNNQIPPTIELKQKLINNQDAYHIAFVMYL